MLGLVFDFAKRFFCPKRLGKKPGNNLQFKQLTRIAVYLIVAMTGLAEAKVKVVPANEFGESGDAEGTYFHLYAEYLIDVSEKLIFDIQVSCGTHSFEDGRLVRGYLPALYAKKTSSGAAVMIATPRVCDAIRFAEGRRVLDQGDFHGSWKQVLSGNFIPFTIEFDDAENLTYGFGYAVSESFDNPASRLSFIDAKIAPSTKKAFSAWFATDSGNLVKEIQLGPRFVNRKDDQVYWATFDSKKELLPVSCFGVAITPHDKRVSQTWAKKYYPTNKPKYWFAPEHLPNTKDEGKPSKEHLVPYTFDRYYSSSLSREFPTGFNYLRKYKVNRKGPKTSFWTIDHSEYYPYIRNDGYPFAKGAEFENARVKYTVDLTPEKRGLLACYSKFNPIGYGIENYQELYEYYFGPDYGPKLIRFGKTVDLKIVDDRGTTQFEGIAAPLALPHFLISDRSAAEFVTFDFFGGGHVE